MQVVRRGSCRWSNPLTFGSGIVHGVKQFQGAKHWVFLKAPVAGTDLWKALVESFLKGDFPPVDLLAVFLVLASLMVLLIIFFRFARVQNL